MAAGDGLERLGYGVLNAVRRHSKEPEETVVDLGYWREKCTRDRYCALRDDGVGRKNFSIEGYGRLLVMLKYRHRDRVLFYFPILAGSTYFGATHHWRGLKAGEAVGRVPTQPASPRVFGKWSK